MFIDPFFIISLSFLATIFGTEEKSDVNFEIYSNISSYVLPFLFIFLMIRAYYLFFKNVKTKKYQIFLTTRMTKLNLFLSNLLTLVIVEIFYFLIELIVTLVSLNVSNEANPVELGKFILEILILWTIAFSVAMLGVIYMLLLGKTLNYHIFWYFLLIIVYCISNKIISIKLAEINKNVADWFLYFSPFTIVKGEDIYSLSIKLLIPITASLFLLFVSIYVAKYINKKVTY
ncbi:hypothetical protein [Spiroplasma tabanidicola]|uniref:Uncharacterized protein n=1 Tax=Spiroplasma tabanidicola TaxID=324079 RepID=A0A6I6CBF2_9MOLU|nr:hypothetical protein [Spiroplasma tabanidicola]QGS52285.1 hypothetical protein STABA_v1c09320 [Spiroplasma tabanidicola]